MALSPTLHLLIFFFIFSGLLLLAHPVICNIKANNDFVHCFIHNDCPEGAKTTKITSKRYRLQCFKDLLWEGERGGGVQAVQARASSMCSIHAQFQKRKI